MKRKINNIFRRIYDWYIERLDVKLDGLYAENEAYGFAFVTDPTLQRERDRIDRSTSRITRRKDLLVKLGQN